MNNPKLPNGETTPGDSTHEHLSTIEDIVEDASSTDAAETAAPCTGLKIQTMELRQ